MQKKGSGGSTLLSEFIAPRARAIDVERGDHSGYANTVADRVALFSAGGNGRHVDLSKSERGAIARSDFEKNPFSSAPDTFDYCSSVMYPVSDSASLVQYRNQNSDRLCATDERKDQTRLRDQRLTRDVPVSSRNSKVKERWDRIFELIKTAAAADEACEYQHAYDLYTEVVKSLHEIRPMLTTDKQPEIQRHISSFRERMNDLQRVLLEQSTLSVDVSCASSNDAENQPPAHANVVTSWKISNSLSEKPQFDSKVLTSSNHQRQHEQERNSSKDPLILKKERDAFRDLYNNLMLGGDSSGIKGQTNAYSLSSAITQLNYSIFGQLQRLEPVESSAVEHWESQIGICLAPLRNIVERRPQRVVMPDGVERDFFQDCQRSDISENLPKLHAADKETLSVLRESECLRGHVSYIRHGDRAANASMDADTLLDSLDNRNWWNEIPKVLNATLPAALRLKLEKWAKITAKTQKDCSDISRSMIAEMQIPADFVEKLPEHARQLFGKYEDLLQQLAENREFTVKSYLQKRNLWDSSSAAELTNILEKSLIIWTQRTEKEKKKKFDFAFKKKDKLQKMHCLRAKAQAAIGALRKQFPFMAHSQLDEAKIRANTDIGKAAVESFARALESRAAVIHSLTQAVLKAASN